MKRVVYGMLLASAALSAPAQVGAPPQDGPPSVSTASVPLTYTGGDSRVSVGVDKDGHTDGELLGVFGNNGEHAIVAQIWWAHGGAGGVQADYNWLWGTTLDEVRRDPDAATVAKLSFAIDQNAEKDRQANIGFAIERKEFFVNLFLSGKASGARGSGSVVDEQHTQQTGTDAVGNYTQSQTDIATTLLEAQPYTYTVGVHGGHFSDALAARFNGGFDYAHGRDGAKQNRLSIGVDKYLGTHGWSVSALAEHAQSDDPAGASRSDNRWWLFLRYEFGGGGAFRSPVEGANPAWIERALRNPVTGHPKTVDTYVRRAKTTSKTVLGPKQYTARRPVVLDDSATVAEGSTANAINVLANDSDPDGNPLSISAIGAPGNGTAQIAGDHVVYTPATGFSGTDHFTYTVSNNKGLSASATVTITVTHVVPPPPPPPPSGNPVARDDAATTPFNTPVVIAVLGNDTDPNKYPLTLSAVTTPGHGTAHVNADGSVTYTPAPGYVGGDRFSYTIGNGHGGTAGANVTITVLPALPPVANDDVATTVFGNPVPVDVLANDIDPYGYFLTVTSVGAPSHGTAQVNGGASVVYTPAAGFVGEDTFDYTISDGHGGLASAHVTVTVLPPNGALVAANDEASTKYATSVGVNVLANDQSPYSPGLTITKVSIPAHGTAVIALNGYIDYKPSPLFDGGVDTFEYTVTDGVSSAVATVYVTVAAPLPPVARDDVATTPFNQPVNVAVLANDADPNGLPLGVASVTTPLHGSAQVNPNGTVAYTPTAGYIGSDSFGYTISNGHGGSASANVSITVQGPLPPIAVADAVSTPYHTPVQINVLGNDSDPNGLALTIDSVSQPTVGSLTPGGNGVFTFSPPLEFTGAASFSYTISNGYLTASATVTINVQQPAQPIATPFRYSGTQPCFKDGNSCDVCVDDFVTNPDGLVFFLSTGGTTQLGGTTLASSGNGCQHLVVYTSPDPSPPNAVDTFTYTVKDEYGRTSSATVSVPIL